MGRDHEPVQLPNPLLPAARSIELLESATVADVSFAPESGRIADIGRGRKSARSGHLPR